MITYKQARKIFRELGIKIYPYNQSLYGLIFIEKDKNKDYSIFEKKDMWFDVHPRGIVIGYYSFYGDDGVSFFDKKDKKGIAITDERLLESFKSEEDFKKWCSTKLDKTKKFLNSLPTKTKASIERKFLFKDGSIVTAATVEEAKAKHKAIARFSPDEKSRLEKCLELLEKQCSICGLKLYFDLDEEKEYVNVYLKPDKKNVYLTVNVGSDSTATAMYDIWKVIHSKI